jgi:chromosome segregation ATPase
VDRLVIFLALTLVPGPLLAQGLGQAAAQERERRDKLAKEGKAAPARSFTNEDLKGKGGSSKEAGASPAAPASASSREGSDGEGSEAAKARGWQQRADQLRARVDQAKARQVSIESRIGQLRQEMNPMNPNYVLDPNRFLRIQDQIRQAESELESVKSQIQAAQDAWSQFEDEARRAGVRMPTTGGAQH